jgi:hypothetical protein
MENTAFTATNRHLEMICDEPQEMDGPILNSSPSFSKCRGIRNDGGGSMIRDGKVPLAQMHWNGPRIVQRAAMDHHGCQMRFL